MNTLRPLDLLAEVLAFEKTHQMVTPAQKEDAIRAVFGCSSIRYHQVLDRILDDPSALEREPSLVARLRRVRDRGSRGTLG